MAFKPQRILKSKYLAYRYFECTRNKNSNLHKNVMPLLAYDDIVKDAIEKVNMLTGKSYTNPPSFPAHKEMYDGNTNMIINGLVEMVKPDDEAPLPNYSMFTIKNNKEFPNVFVLNKAEICRYTIGYLDNLLNKRKFSVISRIMNLITKDKIAEVTGLSKRDLQDECMYAESQLPYMSGNRNAVIFKALCNCNKINILIEYLVVKKRAELFDYFPASYNKKDDLFKPLCCTNEGNYYYIIPYTKDRQNFDVTLN